MHQLIQQSLELIAAKKPLILNITNIVTMDFIANTQLAVGAAPLMTCCEDELEELIAICSSVNINIGTLDHKFLELCDKAITLARDHQKPIILDPVGAGASNIRTSSARGFMKHAAIIRGNASEIIAICGGNSSTMGVESVHSPLAAKELATALAASYGSTFVISGAVDVITDGHQSHDVPYGSALMPIVTGMGCALTGIIACFRAVIDDSFQSAQLATNFYGMCGQITEGIAKSPGSFRTHFIDTLYQARFGGLLK